MKVAKLLLFLGICSMSSFIFAQSTYQEVKKSPVKEEKTIKKHHLFGQIFTGVYHSFGTKKPNTGFGLSSALLGYKYTYKNKLKCTLIYDVTRTTNGFEVRDLNNNILPITYFEGSKYTSFLKMAEAKWAFAPHFYLSSGLLVKQQYLSVQSKVWKHRYVMVTMQEQQRFGNPADFGMRLGYQNAQKFNASLTIVNGNGPFRHQDEESTLEYTANIEYYPISNLLLKVYGSTMEIRQKEASKNKTVVSGFVAYQKKKYTFGAEYMYMNHPTFDASDYSGFSTFFWYNIMPKIELFARYDYIDQSAMVKHSHMYVLGVQYEPVERFFISLNGRRHFQKDNKYLYVNFNVGAKF